MRLFFHLLYLVVLNPVAVVVSTEIPLPSHKDALQRLHARNKERSLRNQDRISRFLSHVRTDDQPVERNLQTSAPTSDSICNADGSVVLVNYVFGAAPYDTSCNCTEGTLTARCRRMPLQPTLGNHSHEILYLNSVLDSNLEEVSTYLRTLFGNATNDATFVDTYNAAIGNIYDVFDYMCVNGCEACVNGTCGILETSESKNLFYNVGNYTYDEIIASGFNQYSSSAYGNGTLLNCVDYTTSEDGKVCFGTEFYAFETETPDDACYFEYDGVPCNSCVEMLEDGFCYIADCTNIEPTAMIDTCNGTGFVGPFTFLQYFFDPEPFFNTTFSTFTIGSCDIFRSPTSPTGTMPTASLPTAPMATTPIASPTSGAVAPAASVPTSGSPGHIIAVKGVLLGKIMIALFTMTMMI
jgi:hypothetical protein